VIRHLSCLIGFGFAIVATAAAAASYRNDAYGIASPISADKPVCLPGESPSDHGFTTLLAGTLADCGQGGNGPPPYVEVFFVGNVLNDKASEAALRRDCHYYNAVLRRLRKPITRAGLRSASGECDQLNGWIDITWATQRRGAPGDSSLSFENIFVTLHTTRARLRHDLPFVKQQVDTLQFCAWE
jgi:hypothetical protein